MVIFKENPAQQPWFLEISDLHDNWNFTAFDKNWTDDDQITILWLKEVFISQTKLAIEGEKRILIVDIHKSHKTGNFMFECYKNNIHLIFY